MNRIKKHLYSIDDGIPVYADLSKKNIVGYLSEGEWVGVIEEENDYYFAVSSNQLGYIHVNDCTVYDGTLSVDMDGANPLYRRA